MYLPDFMNIFAFKVLIFLIVATFMNFTFVCLLNAYFLKLKIKKRVEKLKVQNKEFKVQSEKWSVEENNK